MRRALSKINGALSVFALRTAEKGHEYSFYTWNDFCTAFRLVRSWKVTYAYRLLRMNTLNSPLPIGILPIVCHLLSLNS